MDDVSFAVEPGEVMGFLGSNGAGKSTTLRCLMGLLCPTSGSVRVLGVDPSRDRKALLPEVGYLPGELRLYPTLSGIEHLELLGSMQRKAVSRRDELCDRVQLSKRDLNRPVREYSRGMKQKVGIVQAFQHDPRVAMLDEPTEGLDPIMQRAFGELLDEQRKRQCAVLLSSHVMSQVQDTCTRVAVIRGGRLVRVDSIDSLRDARSRRIRLVLGNGQSPESLGIEQRWQPQWNGSECVLSVSHDEVVDVLRSLLKHDIVDVTVEEAGLNEAVLDLFVPGDAPGAPSAREQGASNQEAFEQEGSGREEGRS